MPRVIELTVPAVRTDAVMEQLRAVDGLLSLRVWRGASVQPPGDVISLELNSSAIHGVVAMVQAQGLGRDDHLRLTTSQPLSLISARPSDTVTLESNNSTWEEMESLVDREAKMDANGMLLMSISGGIAVLGLALNALHLVVGAMLMAPGFEPLLRMSLGLAGRGGAGRRGLLHTARGYGALVAGAMVATLLMRLFGYWPVGQDSTYLPPYALLSFWTAISAPGVLTSLFAGLAGALLVATHRSVLATGVMVALSLVPAAALVGLGLASWNWALVGQGALRWALEVALVVGTGTLVLGLKRRSVQRRDSLL